MIEPWHSLTKIPQKESVQVPAAPETIKSEKSNLKSFVDKLIWDCINYPFDKVRGHIERLDFSVRI